MCTGTHTKIHPYSYTHTRILLEVYAQVVFINIIMSTSLSIHVCVEMQGHTTYIYINNTYTHLQYMLTLAFHKNTYMCTEVHNHLCSTPFGYCIDMSSCCSCASMAFRIQHTCLYTVFNGSSFYSTQPLQYLLQMKGQIHFPVYQGTFMNLTRPLPTCKTTQRHTVAKH